MTGLIWKDILVMRKTVRFYVIFLLCYFGLSVLGAFQVDFVITFSTIMIMVLPISCFSFDEAARWERFARTLPLTPRTIVGARYLFALLVLLAVAAVSSVCVVLAGLLGAEDTPLVENIAAMLGSLGSGVLIIDVMFPLCYRLGPERARPYLFALCLIPFAGVFLLLKFGKDLGLSLAFLNRMPELNALGLIGLFPLAALAGLGASFLLSSRILERKEF